MIASFALLNPVLRRKCAAVFALLFSFGLQPNQACAQGTAFTYQGRLDDGGLPANGTYDFRFTLHDAATGGNVNGRVNDVKDLVVSNGLFTASLDFGTGFFDGSARWLQISVRPGLSTAPHTELNPRQPIQPTPYALFAAGASASGIQGRLPAGVLASVNGGGLTNLNAAQLSGTVSDARLSANVALRNGGNTFGGDQILSDGKLGIGTASPATRLELAGPSGTAIRVSGPGGNDTTVALDLSTYAPESYGSTNSPARVEARDSNWSAHLDFQTKEPGDAANSMASRLFIQNEGRVGIGTTTPHADAKLHVTGRGYFSSGTGSIQQKGLHVLFDDPTEAGMIHAFDTLANQPKHLYLQMPGGNVGIGKLAPATKLDVGGEITCTALNITSDRNAKERFKPVNARQVLDKVASLPITEWQYKTQGDARHIGPMAQDFHAAFGTGRDDRHIPTVDADGVALAAIQGLNQKLEEQVRQKDAELGRLQSQNQSLAARLSAIEHALGLLRDSASLVK